MRVVVDFVEYRFRETIAVLRSVLRRTLRGEVFGLALCVGTKEGEKYYFTGIFRQNSAQALKAANRMSWKMNQAMDEQESGFGLH